MLSSGLTAQKCKNPFNLIKIEDFDPNWDSFYVNDKITNAEKDPSAK